MIQTDITHFHLFCGSGSGAAGFNDALPAIPGLQANMVCLGGMDVDPVGAEDFRMLTGMPCTVRATRMRDPFDTMRYWLIEHPNRRGHGARGQTLRDALDVAMAISPEVKDDVQ